MFTSVRWTRTWARKLDGDAVFVPCPDDFVPGSVRVHVFGVPEAECRSDRLAQHPDPAVLEQRGAQDRGDGSSDAHVELSDVDLFGPVGVHRDDQFRGVEPGAGGVKVAEAPQLAERDRRHRLPVHVLTESGGDHSALG